MRYRAQFGLVLGAVLLVGVLGFIVGFLAGVFERLETVLMRWFYELNEGLK
jgi:ABC-type dipeptide/oligopeptide/nickel transport system permease subunit